MGYSWLEILHDPMTQRILGFDIPDAGKVDFITAVDNQLAEVLEDTSKHLPLLKIGYTALEAFLQANCTGPPLDFNPEEAIFPPAFRSANLPNIKLELFNTLMVDGTPVYHLTPHIELFWFAKLIMANPTLADAGFNGRRARFRVNCWHQKLLTDKSDTMRNMIYFDTDVLEQQLGSRLTFGGAAAEEHFVEFLMERAMIKIFYGDDAKAREDLIKAAKTRSFQFALIGALGKRTKFQERDLSQLVVLAKSRDFEPEPYSSRKSSRADSLRSRQGSVEHRASSGSRASTTGHTAEPRSRSESQTHSHASGTTAISHRAGVAVSPRPGQHHEHAYNMSHLPSTPKNFTLNDDTLLEHIQFKSTAPYEPDMTHITDSDVLPPRLTSLNPADQPQLFPVDSIILLATASSISNTSPDDGLTREETLPYATRVLQGGSSNWQVYTQALLVRSRIEGFRSRTAERGLLQLQALVDQIIAETSGKGQNVENMEEDETHANTQKDHGATTFIPKVKPWESASVAERLKYIYQLAPPLRWELEAELAARWTQMGGLKTALEIYERLQMHAEHALCLAATDQEAEAKKLLRGLLFDSEETQDNHVDTNSSTDGNVSTQTMLLRLRHPPPADTPRLLCILGDITNHPNYYQLAWTASNYRYGRAQKSLGRYFVKRGELAEAGEAYKLALDTGRLDLSTWFALGCVELELRQWSDAVESFTRCVQIDDMDAQAWSNLAVALLRLPGPKTEPEEPYENLARVMSSADLDEHAIASSTENGSTPDENTDDGEFADEDYLEPVMTVMDPYRHTREALNALRRAAGLRHDDARIWDNYLTVAASIPPSAGTPWEEILQAMRRVIEIRGKKEGEGAVDLNILRVLTDYITTEFDYPGSESEAEIPEPESEAAESRKREDSLEIDPTEINPAKPIEDIHRDSQMSPTDTRDQLTGFSETNPATTPTPDNTHSLSIAIPRPILPFVARQFLNLIDTLITPLATSSPELYHHLSRMSSWRHRPAESLSYSEKAWRSTTSAAGAYDSEAQWDRCVDETVKLVEAYMTLGPMKRERADGEALVEKGWKFKCRSCVRGVMGRGKENWEDTKGWMKLKEILEKVGSFELMV